MKLSISNIAWDANDDDEMYKYLQECKIEGIEIAPTRIFPDSPYERLKEAKEYSDFLWNKYNLKISSMQSIWYGKLGNIFNKEEATELLDYSKKAINFAGVIDCKNLVFGCPKNRNILEGCYDFEVATFFKKIGEYALNSNTTFALEPNPTIYNTNFLNTTSETLKFIDLIESEGIKLNLDIGTMIQNNEDINKIREYVKYVNHIHISEPYLEKIVKRQEHKIIADILKKAEYKNYVSIEMKNQGNIELVKETIGYILEVFR